MRKKYLSALLFGALLLASAGTFTSCKDYDDDIKNLQEQINTVKTSLDELTTKVNSLGAGVKEFKYENGKLILVTDKDTNFEVELPACDGIKELEIKNGILYADGVEVGPIGGEGTTIEGDKVEVKDGILYINGEPQDLKDEVGSKVIVIDNNDGTYTLTVGSDSYVLPKASASVGIAFVNPGDQYFTNLSGAGTNPNAWEGGIQWGTADKYRGNWGGLKPVAKGNLLVGKISTVQVEVSAATFDLETAKLTLVNTLGEEAPVVVTPVAEGKQGPATGSRAADARGVWNLNIEMKPSVTAENIDVAFAAKNYNTGYDYKNVKYALAIDGKVVTDYEIFVDTQTGKAVHDFVFWDGASTTGLYFVKYGEEERLVGGVFGGTGLIEFSDARPDQSLNTLSTKLPIGETTTLCLDALNGTEAVDYVYDSYIEICDQDLADEKGISAEGMNLTVSEDAAALEKFPVIIHILDVNGNEFKTCKINLNFAASKDSGVALEDQQYVVMPSVKADKRFVLVDLGNTFTGLTAAEANAISTNTTNHKTGSVKLYSTKDNKLFGLNTAGGQFEDMYEILNSSTVTFYENKEDALAYGLDLADKADESIKFTTTISGTTVNVNASTIRKIRYAVVPFDAIKSNAMPNVKAPFTIILRDIDGNEVKRASAHYTVNLPAFDDVLVANSNKVWKENTFYTRVATTNGSDAIISLVQPFKSKVAEDQIGYIDLNTADEWLSYELKYTDFAKKDQYIDIFAGPIKTATMSGDVVSDDKELVHDIDVVATLNVLGNSYDNFKVTKEFKVYLQSIFEGASVSYYVDNNAVTGAVTLDKYRYIYPGYEAGGKKQGLYMNFDGEVKKFTFTNGAVFTQGYKAEIGLIQTNKPAFTNGGGPKDANSYIYMGDGAVGNLNVTPVTVGTTVMPSLDIVLGESNGGQLIFTFVDMMGVEVDATLDYQKNAPAAE